MENTVNQRVILLKTHLEWNNQEFCEKTGLATSTLWNIQKGIDMKPKTIRAIVEKTGVNKEWLLTGKGNMLRTDTGLTEAAKKENDHYQRGTVEVWQDATYKSLQDQIQSLKDEVKKAWAIASHFSGDKLNFLSPLSEPGSASQPFNERNEATECLKEAA